ncbi:MAG: nicotinamide riboside transporter PnuC [Bacteroidales bacterium]|nr:nicotinamide riboside transporter PnuC [Bacteroidales bacterium]
MTIDWITSHIIEITGAVTGIIYVLLEIKQKIWLWPLGIVTSSFYVVVFFQSGFYADMGLQFYYLFISVYGWYWWLKGRSSSDSGSLKVTNIKKRGLFFSLLLFLVLFALIWVILASFTDSQLPGWDSFTTALAIVATWMLARKYIEHWYLWMVANTVSIGLYIFKELYPTVILFAVYTVMSFVGYMAWKRSMQEEESTNSLKAQTLKYE